MMTRIALFLVALLPLAAASDAGNEGWTVPPFKCFGTTPIARPSRSPKPREHLDSSTKTLFAVNNGDRMIYEIEYPNKLVQKWDVKALTLDLEGISALGGRKFAITDENPVKIIEVTLNGLLRRHGSRRGYHPEGGVQPRIRGRHQDWHHLLCRAGGQPREALEA